MMQMQTQIGAAVSRESFNGGSIAIARLYLNGSLQPTYSSHNVDVKLLIVATYVQYN